MYAKGVKVYQFKAKDFEIKPHTLCLGYVSKGFTNYNMKKMDWMDMFLIFHLITEALILMIL